MNDLLEFLDHAGDKGLMPAATAQALAVASRNVLAVLSDKERDDLSTVEIASVVKRFTTKRAKDFTQSSLKEYGRRVNRAVELFLRWREDPANFAVKTRSTASARRKNTGPKRSADTAFDSVETQSTTTHTGGYQSSVPVRPGVVITLANIPHDLTKAEAGRLADFVRLLAVE